MTITEPKIYPFVYVRWKDASHASGTWQNECEDPLEPVLDCETGGFLIKQTTDFIIVAAAIAYHEDVVTPSFASEITIPMCAVSEIRIIDRDNLPDTSPTLNEKQIEIFEAAEVLCRGEG